MRFYTEDEAKELVSYFNDTFLKDESFDGFYMESPLTVDELLTTNTMKFSEFKEKYKLNYGDDTYDEYIELVSNNEGVRDEFTEINTYNDISEEEFRYPVIILGNNNSNGDDVPDIANFLELTYMIKHFDDENLEIIVIDKMKKPFDNELLNRMADFYGFDNYDYSLYS